MNLHISQGDDYYGEKKDEYYDYLIVAQQKKQEIKNPKNLESKPENETMPIDE